MIVILSDHCERKARAIRVQSYATNLVGGFAEADRLRAEARKYEDLASRMRPALVTVCIPIKSQTSFGAA